MPKMIAFIPVYKNGKETAKRLLPKFSFKKKEAAEIIDSFFELQDEYVQFGFAVFSDLLLVRICDGGEYFFVYPIALADGLDESAALEELRKYAVKEEIPLTFCDLPKERLEICEEAFRFTAAYPDDEGEIYTVKALTELDRYPDELFVTDGEAELSPLAEKDISAFARLSRDTELNKYWGYDYREDNNAPSDEWFFERAKADENNKVAVSLAVRHEGKFVGEACLWGFDLKGGAELGFRILPEFQGRGLGKKALELLLKLGEEICLSEIYASVKKENLRSLRLVEKCMTKFEETEETVKFIMKF